MSCESQRLEIQVSDWSVRPLSERQLQYAALDAALLLHLFDAMATHSSLKCADLSGLYQDWRAGSRQQRKEPSNGKSSTLASSDANSYGYPHGATVELASEPFIPGAAAHQTPAKVSPAPTGAAHNMHFSTSSRLRGTGGSAPSRGSSCNACQGNLAAVRWPRLGFGGRHVSSHCDSLGHDGSHGRRRHVRASSLRCTAQPATAAENRHLHVTSAHKACSVTTMVPVPAMQTARVLRALANAALRRICRVPRCQVLVAVV